MEQKILPHQPDDYFFSVVEHGDEVHTGAYRRRELDEVLASAEELWSSQLDGSPADAWRVAQTIAWAFDQFDCEAQAIGAAHLGSLLLVRRKNEAGLREMVAAGGAVIATAQIDERRLSLRMVERTDPCVAEAIAQIFASERGSRRLQ